MVSLKSFASVTRYPVVYQAWQAPFVAAKFAPIIEHNDLESVKRVLDVGCGPGTNAGLFTHTDYWGIDINHQYIEAARQRFPGHFITADVCQYQMPPDERFDFILLNSLLHHIDTANVLRILHRLHGLLTQDGHVHILELVLPENRSVARWLARSDRGDYPRSLRQWSSMFEEVFDPVLFEPYAVSGLGMTLWQMVYFKGRAKA